MRIGIDGRYIADHYPGIGRYTYSLVRAFGRLPAEERFLVYVAKGQQNSRYPIEELPAGRVRLRRVAVPCRTLREQLAWRHWVDADDLDVVLCPYYIKPYLLQAPTVITLHDIIPLMGRAYLPSTGARMLYYLLTWLAISRSTRVITSSEASRSAIAAGFPGAAEKLCVVPGAADPPSVPPADPRIDGPYLLYVGTNKPHKNLVRLVRAFAAARVKVRLVLAGQQDPRYTEVAETIRSLRLEDRVDVLGAVDEARLEGLYRGAIATIVPSLVEGFGLPVLEAMIRGCPVLCSNQSSLPEVAGDAAHYFDPTREVQIATAIEEIVDDADLREQLAERGRQRAERAFSWEQTARKTLSVIHHAVAEW